MQYEIEDKGRFKMIHIIGDITPEVSTGILDNAISELITSGHHDFVFNLERTTYLDSSGISIFIHCLCDVQENNGSIYIIAEDNQVRDVLNMVGIDRLIKVYNGEKEFLEEQKVEVS
ncbi:MAG: STAS domain-containing protein [Chitinivibrionales bacterium]|nr:STAS domain-containing protein [Chitinivibrionales bacterium]MBD3397283.1 STAS domain-containing protein [Chitinivibrionales bacterium]